MTKPSAIYRIKRSLRGCRPRLSLELALFDEEYCLELFGFMIALPFLDRWHREPHEIMESWGLHYADRALVLKWGRRSKFIHMPWEFEFIKWEVMLPNFAFVPKDTSFSETPNDGRWVGTYPYHYQLRNGEVQERMATIYVERGYWQWRIAKRLRFPLWFPVVNMMQQTIEVRFNDEVGERTGSWKGGCIGCSYTMQLGEPPVETLRRMERERKFN